MKMLAREKILTSVTVLLVIVLAGITVTYATPMSLSMDALRGGYHIEEGISTDGKIFMPIGDAVPPRSLEVMKQKWGLPIHSLPIGRYNGDVEDISKIGVCISTNDNATHGETLTTNVSVMFECNSNITVEIVPIGIDELRPHRKITYRNQLLSCTQASLGNME